jgi:hypothetical protein
MIKGTDIKEHMEVLAADGEKIGTVDHLEGSDKIKLTKSGSPDRKHHFIPLSLVDHIDRHVHLNKGAQDVRSQWSDAA